MKFIMAYSGGKDCTLAMDEMLREGHELVGLYVACTQSQFNFKHGIRREIFESYAQALGGVRLFESHAPSRMNMDEPLAALREAAARTGAEAVCTGDIFQEAIYEWNQELADRAGLKLVCPLWQRSSADCVKEVLARGYRCLIKTIKTDLLPVDIIGKPLDDEMIALFAERGVDLCGENGEYHTITVAGPAFSEPIPVVFGSVLESKGYASVDAVLGVADK